MAEHSDLHHLQENPQLIESFLSENIYQLTAEELLTLIKIYQTVPQYNERLFLFAQGRVAFLQQDYAEATRLYRLVLSENPTLNPVRIELALALFYQKQDRAAQMQFEKAKSGLSGGFSAVQEKVGEGVDAVKEATSKEKTRVH